MPKTISATELQKQPREAIDYARVKKDAVIIESYGRPMAVILSYEEYQTYLAYRESQASRQQRFSLLRESAANNAAFNKLTEEEALRLADEIRQEVYDQLTGRVP